MTLGGDIPTGTMEFLGTISKATIEKKAELDEKKAELELSHGSRPHSGSKPLSTNGSSRPTSALLGDKSGGALNTLAPLGANTETLEQFRKTQVCSRTIYKTQFGGNRPKQIHLFPQSHSVLFFEKNRHP
jgi:hypothetical protein